MIGQRLDLIHLIKQLSNLIGRRNGVFKRCDRVQQSKIYVRVQLARLFAYFDALSAPDQSCVHIGRVHYARIQEKERSVCEVQVVCNVIFELDKFLA